MWAIAIQTSWRIALSHTVCLSVNWAWAHQWALQKRINRSSWSGPKVPCKPIGLLGECTLAPPREYNGMQRRRDPGYCYHYCVNLLLKNLVKQTLRWGRQSEITQLSRGSPIIWDCPRHALHSRPCSHATVIKAWLDWRLWHPRHTPAAEVGVFRIGAWGLQTCLHRQIRKTGLGSNSIIVVIIYTRRQWATAQ